MSEREDKDRDKPEAEAPPASDSTAASESAGGGEQRMDLPKWNRARVKRKAPAGQEEDAFQHSVRQAGRQAVTRAPVVIGGIILIAALIAGVIWYQGSSEEESAEMTRTLSKAAAYAARGQVVPDPEDAKVEGPQVPWARPVATDEAKLSSQVEEALETLGDEAPEAAANRMADLVRAGRAMEEGKFSEAEPLYRRFLERSGTGHPLSFAAREGLAFALAGLGNDEEALSELDQLAGEEGDFYRDQALYAKAQLLERAGRKDDAIAVYRQYIEEYPLTQPSLASREVRTRLEELDPEALPDDLPPATPPGLELP